MSKFGTIDLIKVQKGEVGRHSIVQKFGEHPAVGTSFVPISVGGIYRTPPKGSAIELRVKAGGNINDTAAGSGAQEITFIGTNDTGAEIVEAVATAGASASANTTAKFMRFYRAFVSKSGTYASLPPNSHADNIVIEDKDGLEDWGTISADEIARGQTTIGWFTIPTGFRGYLLSATAFSDSSKTTQLICFKRPLILETAAPYSGIMREMFEMRSEGDEMNWSPKAPTNDKNALIGPCDVGFMGKVNQGTAEIKVDYEILLVQDPPA